jgi:hypothetical protein
MKQEKTLADVQISDLTDTQYKNVWQLIDDWYNNTDIWDLLNLSGIIDTPISEL